jgi:ankyrin repeat protein
MHTQYQGRTPLQLAAGAGNAPLVKVLLDAGADPSFRDPKGLTAREIALESKDNRWREVVQLLDEALAKRKTPGKK